MVANILSVENVSHTPQPPPPSTITTTTTTTINTTHHHFLGSAPSYVLFWSPALASTFSSNFHFCHSTSNVPHLSPAKQRASNSQVALPKVVIRQAAAATTNHHRIGPLTRICDAAIHGSYASQMRSGCQARGTQCPWAPTPTPTPPFSPPFFLSCQTRLATCSTAHSAEKLYRFGLPGIRCSGFAQSRAFALGVWRLRGGCAFPVNEMSRPRQAREWTSRTQSTLEDLLNSLSTSRRCPPGRCSSCVPCSTSSTCPQRQPCGSLTPKRIAATAAVHT